MYQSFIPISYKFKNQSDVAIYNYQYQYPFKSTEVVAFPLNPIVKGKIKRQDVGQPIQNVQVKLLNWAVFCSGGRKNQPKLQTRNQQMLTVSLDLKILKMYLMKMEMQQVPSADWK